MENMTAKVSCFARAYHFKHNDNWIFADSEAENMLTEAEYNSISENMQKGIQFFAPGFQGSEEEALRFIVDRQLSPSVLIRSAFCEDALKVEMRLLCRQYVLFASGYDTFALRNKKETLRIFELDREEMIEDKKRRIAGSTSSCIACDLGSIDWIDKLRQAGFDENMKSFGSLLGLSYYLKKEEFGRLLDGIAGLWSEGSAICFDYPTVEKGSEASRHQTLAAGAGEQMKASYTFREMEKLLEENGFLIYAHYDEEAADEVFCSGYNKANGAHPIHAPKGVNYCLAVRKN